MQQNHNESKYVWYACYGSNMCQERFICYIKGGEFKLGGSYCVGCKDKTLPRENKTIKLRHSLYFARKSSGWGGGGVAFISAEKEEDPKNWTLGRMWKITSDQFEEVKEQEGPSWYDYEVGNLGEEEGIPIKTITSKKRQTFNSPVKNYLSTITMGLIEAYKLRNKAIYNYLHEKDGIKGYLSDEELKNIVNECFLT